MTWPAAHPLRGVRLGKLERWLLSNAPSPDALFGLVLDTGDPSSQETLRRAAVKLEKIGLLERHRMRVYVRARDRRGEGLVFRDGGFWVRADPTGAHAVRRNVVWLSPFGFQIVLRYVRQLWSGEPIRWDARTVDRALDQQRAINRSHRHLELTAREEDERDGVVLADRSRRALAPAVPAEVTSSGQAERLELAVAVARDRAPEARSDALWDQALELWASYPPHALQAAVASIPRPQPTRSEQFRRRRHSLLGR